MSGNRSASQKRRWAEHHAAVGLAGQRFGLLTLVERFTSDKNRSMWRCRCDCGAETVASQCHLKTGHKRSCGCLHMPHGHSRNRNPSGAYRSWSSMIERCTEENSTSWVRYGARGITICESWRHSFPNFLADMGERPAGKSLDRWPDNNGNYEPANCRWATPREQALNRRTTKLDDASIAAMREMRRKGALLKDIGAAFGVGESRAGQVVKV